VHINGKNPGTAEHAAFEVVDVKELARRWCVKPHWIYDRTRSRSGDPVPTVLGAKKLLFAWGSPRLEAWWQRQVERGRPRRKASHKVSKQRSGGGFERKEMA
jgi:hypothetical protein